MDAPTTDVHATRTSPPAYMILPAAGVTLENSRTAERVTVLTSLLLPHALVQVEGSTTMGAGRLLGAATVQPVTSACRRHIVDGATPPFSVVWQRNMVGSWEGAAASGSNLLQF